jgi:SAM-dependent methyltransferase
MDNYHVCSDVNFRIESDGVLASNFRVRRHVWLNLPLFNAIAGHRVEGELCAADLTRFTNIDGLLADPTCLDLAMKCDQVTFSELNEAAIYLAEHLILIRDEQDYETYIAPKKSMIDHHHFGTFHQQLGAELQLRYRVDPGKWWYEQKFDPASGEVRDTLYKFIQDNFQQDYFDSMDLQGKTVLDFGCGSGLAARHFINRGARVIGIDPDTTLLENAKNRLGDKFTPVPLLLSERDPLSAIPSVPIDLVWLGDVFLFYFYPQDGRASPIAPDQLLRRLAAFLKPDGLCVIMQPHGVFWLAPWLGTTLKPYTVISEYMRRLYNVVPGLQEMSDAISSAGLAISHIYEPMPDPSAKAIDEKAYSFASEFPLWWVFECVKFTK